MELSQNRLSQKPAEKPEKESFLKNLGLIFHSIACLK